MGCKFSKTNKVLPVVKPTHVKPATLSPASHPAKKGLGKRRSGKKKPPVTRDTPQAANNDASPAVDASHPFPGAESTQQNDSYNLHPLAERQQSVDYAPIRLVKEADVCNREVTPFNLHETPETLMIKRCSHGSFKTDPLICAGSSDSGIALATGENNEYAKIITEKSSPEKQEIAKVPDTPTPDLTIQGMYIRPPYRPSQIGKLGAVTAKRPLSARPHLRHLQMQPHLSLQQMENDKHDKVKLLSIVERPSSRGGLAFDVNFDDNNGVNKKMPKVLQKKVKSTNLTKEELQAKLDAAEQRRKAREEEKQEKIRAQLEHDRQVMSALEAFQKSQMAKMEAKLNKKMAANEENREKHFRELKNRVKEKSDRMMAAMEEKALRPPIIKDLI